jgi:hypothetical protein
MSQATAAAKWAVASKRYDMAVKAASYDVRELRREIRDVNGLSTPLSLNDGEAMDKVCVRLFAKKHAEKVVEALALKLQAEYEWEEAHSYAEKLAVCQPK